MELGVPSVERHREEAWQELWEQPAGLNSSGDKGTAAEQGVPPKHPQFPGGAEQGQAGDRDSRGVLRPAELSR